MQNNNIEKNNIYNVNINIYLLSFVIFDIDFFLYMQIFKTDRLLDDKWYF